MDADRKRLEVGTLFAPGFKSATTEGYAKRQAETDLVHDAVVLTEANVEDETNELSLKEGYLAMCSFLEIYNARGPTDDMEEMLCNLALSSQGKPAGSTSWPDWLRCVERAKAGEVNANLILVKKT
jgi:hypothetical protein